MYSLALATGVVQFTANDIREPPALRIAYDITLLFRWWDDSSKDWDPRNYPFLIKSRHVPLKYWATIYRHTEYWKAQKNQWHLWKVCLVVSLKSFSFILLYIFYTSS